MMTEEKSPAVKLEAVNPAREDSSMLLPVISPERVEAEKSMVKPAPVAPPVKVPTEVREEPVTPAARVVPVKLPASTEVQVRLPEASMALAKSLPVQSVGLAKRAVAVSAFPEISIE